VAFLELLSAHLSSDLAKFPRIFVAVYMPKRWFPAAPRPHVALDDAREQGLLFINLLKENLDAFRT
jgi:hypothetical protein